MSMLVEEIANSIQARLLGKGTAEISGVASLESAGATHLVFVENTARLEQAIASSAGAIIAAEFAANAKATKPILIVADPRLAFARAARLLVRNSEISRIGSVS